VNSKYEDTIKKNGEDRTERNIKSSAVSIETMNFDAAQSETDAVQRAALSALAIEGAAGRGVSIVLTDDETIHAYNREYRDVDRATDVLSFPMMEYDTPGGFDEGDEILSIPDDFLGDIMISVPRAAEQGAALGHSTERELMFLTVHGVLHLLGFDHMRPEDETVMLEHQRRIMSAIAKQIDGCTE